MCGFVSERRTAASPWRRGSLGQPPVGPCSRGGGRGLAGATVRNGSPVVGCTGEGLVAGHVTTDPGSTADHGSSATTSRKWLASAGAGGLGQTVGRWAMSASAVSRLASGKQLGPSFLGKYSC